MKISTLTILSVLLFCNPNPTNGFQSLASTIYEWLDPDLAHKKQQVLAVVNEFRGQQKTRNSPQTPNEDFGFSFPPGTKFDWICLTLIKGKKEKSLKNRVPFVNLGCGDGSLSTLAVFAGALVDAVDLKETVTRANANIYTKTKNIIGYTKENSQQYYRAIPADLLDETPSAWTQTPHTIALCSNVIHFFLEGGIKSLAKKVFDNLPSDSAFLLQTDTPLFSQSCLDFYLKRRGTTLFPGLAIYNKKIGSDGLSMIGMPIPFDEIAHTPRPGKAYEGQFTEDGKVIENKECYHNVKNLFLTEELVTIFTSFGFKAVQKFYLNHVGEMIYKEGELPKIGKPSKACVLFVKP